MNGFVRSPRMRAGYNNPKHARADLGSFFSFLLLRGLAFNECDVRIKSAGSRATQSRQPRQVRKEATVTG